MRKIPLLTLLLLFMASLTQAYSTKIILSTFSNDANAKRSLEAFKKTTSYKELYKLSKKNDFKVYVRESGSYHIVVVEPIYSREVGCESHKIAKQEYDNSYLSPYKTPKKSELRKPEETPKKIVKKEVPKLEKPKPSESLQKVKKEKVMEKKIAIKDNADSIAKTIDFAMDLVSLLKYAGIFLVFAILLYYYRKFKRIYDEY